MPLSGPRVVVVTRPTEYACLLAAHGTHEQARFFLGTRGQSIDDVNARHTRQAEALASVSRAIPRAWRRAHVERTDLSRFVFEPDDIIVAVGQDGLVANAAKYLHGQSMIGLNPDRALFDGVLARHPAEAAGDLLATVVRGRARVEQRTMVAATLDDGQKLTALNEIFVGHRSHQSARYRISFEERSERQSSSGIVVATGTGSTGWARSIHRERATQVGLPRPDEKRLAFFVREAFPSVATGVDLTEGLVTKESSLTVVSEMGEGGAIFGDGLEEDRIAVAWGTRVTIDVSDRTLNLVTG
jgi:NAD kinase